MSEDTITTVVGPSLLISIAGSVLINISTSLQPGGYEVIIPKTIQRYEREPQPVVTWFTVKALAPFEVARCFVLGPESRPMCG